MDKLELIVEMVKEVRDGLKVVAEDQKETNQHLFDMKADVHLNRKDLELHMEQTRAVKELALSVREEANSRIEKVETKLTAGYLLKLIVTVAGGLGTVAGAVYGISRII